MNNIQKLALVPSELVPPQNNPMRTQLGRLDLDMKTILDTTNIPEDIKAKLYQDKLTKYLAAQDEKKKPIPVPIKDEPPGTAPQPAPQVPVQPYVINRGEIIQGMPSLKINQANRLLTFLEHNRNVIRWSERNELMDGGNPIRGSNITELVHAACRDTVQVPIGWAAFRQQLLARNIPRNAIGSRMFDTRGVANRVAVPPLAAAAGRVAPVNRSPRHTRTYYSKNQHGRGLKWLTIYK